MVFTEYPKQGIALFIGFGRAMFKLWSPMYFWDNLGVLQAYCVVLRMNNTPPIM